MLIFDFRTIGNRLLSIRKRLGMTQAEVAEKAELSDRAYADIERGTVNMRVETLLRICDVFHVTPNEILVDEQAVTEEDCGLIISRLDKCTAQDRKTAFRLLSVFLNSLN